jgi:hypothetical protein
LSGLGSLPISPLAELTAVAISTDGKYLALSTQTRGALWELENGKQIVMFYDFTDATWTSGDTLYLDIAKQGKTARYIGKISMKDHLVKNLTYTVDDETHMRYGMLTDWKQDVKRKPGR